MNELAVRDHVQVLVALILDGRYNTRVPMSNVVYCEPAHQIQILLAFAIGQVATFGMHNVQCQRVRAGLGEVIQERGAK